MHVSYGSEAEVAVITSVELKIQTDAHDEVVQRNLSLEPR